MATTADKRSRYYNDAAILVRLARGPATSGDLAKAVYGENDDYGRRAVWVAIHRLRKRGVGIVTETGGNWKRDWRQYRLACATPCPYCGGAGVVGPGSEVVQP